MLVALGAASRHGGSFPLLSTHGRRTVDTIRALRPDLDPYVELRRLEDFDAEDRVDPPRCQVPQHSLQRFQRAHGRLLPPLRCVWLRTGFSSQELASRTTLLPLTMYPVASPIRSRTNWVPGSWVWIHRNVWSSRIARLESRQGRPRVARRSRCCPRTQ